MCVLGIQCPGSGEGGHSFKASRGWGKRGQEVSRKGFRAWDSTCSFVTVSLFPVERLQAKKESSVGTHDNPAQVLMFLLVLELIPHRRVLGDSALMGTRCPGMRVLFFALLR